MQPVESMNTGQSLILKQLFLSFLLVLGFSSCDPTENPTPTKTPAPQVTITTVITPTPSNSAVLTLIAQTPFPTPLYPHPPNETGIIPGETTADMVKSLYGPPLGVEPDASRGSVSWEYNTPKMQALSLISFFDNIAQEITLRAPTGLTAEQVVAEYGAPNAVAFLLNQSPEYHLQPPPTGYLLYLSRGIYFTFVCRLQQVRQCLGVPKRVEVFSKTYFVPMTLGEWLSTQASAPPILISPWGGFSD